MSELIVAFGLVAVIEGLCYAAAPSAMKKAVRQVLTLPDATIRTGGVIAMAIGVLVVWMAKG